MCPAVLNSVSMCLISATKASLSFVLNITITPSDQSEKGTGAILRAKWDGRIGKWAGLAHGMEFSVLFFFSSPFVSAFLRCFLLSYRRRVFYSLPLLLSL
ncbi:hypothetical protein ASPTUDRAFT_626732 [Aspergillus tubingensis CBS 134.48]|uniref:Secreted protein n=1 Tax=Aspergillus tubingensis (strain CBS 134.48) TaxID=767770 RepID=A0A1L9N414_ASPTC|nr:hypothetical protein ASPTUDRAFT_626732 [Aspergillus tubingensis CBS 134.48]